MVYFYRFSIPLESIHIALNFRAFNLSATRCPGPERYFCPLRYSSAVSPKLYFCVGQRSYVCVMVCALNGEPAGQHPRGACLPWPVAISRSSDSLMPMTPSVRFPPFSSLPSDQWLNFSPCGSTVSENEGYSVGRLPNSKPNRSPSPKPLYRQRRSVL